MNVNWLISPRTQQADDLLTLLVEALLLGLLEIFNLQIYFWTFSLVFINIEMDLLMVDRLVAFSILLIG